jgi:hypothetical protein
MRYRFLGSTLALLSWLTVSPSGAFGAEIDDGAIDVAAEAGQTRLLVWKDDRLSVRTLPLSGEPTGTPEEGPFLGWTAIAISDGPDGRSRALWVNEDGRAGLGVVGPTGSEAAFQYPSIPAWSAIDVAATRDGGSSLLWTSASGGMRLATIDDSGAATLGPQYGPYTGWSALALAEGVVGSTWVLWRSTDGRVSVSRHRGGVVDAALRLDANPDWAAEDLAVAADGRPRLLRVHPDGRASLATLHAGGSLVDERIHSEAGFAPRRISAGPDGFTRLLWRSADGAEKVSLFNLDNTLRIVPSPTPPPTPTPAGPPIQSTWRGSFRGPGLNEQIQATVHQTANHITIGFQGDIGSWEFRGTQTGAIRGGIVVSGNLYGGFSGDYSDHLRGEVYARRISLDGADYHITLSR